MLSEILEAVMILTFGMAWPASIAKSWHSRTARGKSINFLILVAIGYLCGILSKFVAGTGTVSYVVILYFINLLAVATDIALYFRNLRLDRMAAD